MKALANKLFDNISSELNNVFTADNIELITIHVAKKTFADPEEFARGEWVFEGIIHFRKDKTKGMQTLYGHSMKELFDKMETFYENLR